MQKQLSIFFVPFFLIFFSLSSIAQVKGDSVAIPIKDTNSFLINNKRFFHHRAVAPLDSAKLFTVNPNDSHGVRQFNPRTATIRSAILPGWGQAYNRKYWKIPIVYAALGTTAGIFLYNLKNYNQFKKAYKQSVTDNGVIDDPLIEPDLRIYSQQSLLAYRNEFRQNIDYSVLFFLLFWGLNVVDATVDAHLKSFDVSDDISIEIKPGHSYIANTDGLSLVMKIGKRY
ncbi:MAG TPA: DUF5683 domain-containing protein [Ferruginibacter sp.]|nr:DUF5683 domain-containing protein [Ferruginibacter sp.]